VGTSSSRISLAHAPDLEGRPQRAAELLLAARLTKEELFGVPSGVNAKQQLDRLLDRVAEHRWADDGTMVEDGDSMRFVPGPTEWRELYGLPEHPEDRDPSTPPSD